MRHMLCILASCGLAAAEPAGALSETHDLIPDSSLECGHDWWSFERSVYLDAGTGADWLPAVDDPAQPWHGALSLRLDNPRGDAWMLTSGDVALEPGAEYTLSFSARAAVAGTVLTLGTVGRENDHWGRAGNGSWTLGTAWERRSVVLKAPPGHRWFTLRFAHDGQGGRTTTGAVWMDAIQLSRNPGDMFAPPAIEAGVQEPVRFHATDSRGPWPVALRLRNHGPTPRQTAVAWTVVDTADGRTVAQGRSDAVALPASATTPVDLEVSPHRRGSFDLRWAVVDAADGARLAWGVHGFALVDPAPAAGPGFAIGGQFSLRADWEATDWATRSTVRLRGCSLDEQIRYRIDSGESWLRAWDFRWAAIEPREGAYDWSVTDLLVDACQARRLRVVGSTDTLIVEESPQKRFSRVPEWAQTRWGLRPGGGSGACKVTAAPPEAWARHLGAAAARYRGRVEAWEIMNEPNLWLSAEQYVAYLRAASAAIRAADPAAKVVGVCATGDLGGRLIPFLDGCAAGGALDLLDAVTFHPYDSRQDSSPHPADRGLSELRALLVQRGKPDLPLWNSELFYLHPRPVAHEYWDFLWQRGPEVARRHLTDLAGGVPMSACVESSSYVQRTLAPRSWDDRSRKPVPNRHFVVLNALARCVGGARPAPGGIVAGPGRLHRFVRADGSPAAAAWSADPGEAALLLRLPGGSGAVAATDSDGNPAAVRSEGDDLVAILGPDPLYLQPAAGAPGFTAAIDRATIAFRDPWMVAARAGAGIDGRPALCLCATSRSDAARTGEVRVTATVGGRIVASDRHPLALAAGATATWSIALDPAVVPGATLVATIDAVSDGVAQPTTTSASAVPPIAVCPALPATPAIDGQVDAGEWAGAGSLEFPRGDRAGNWLTTWRGPDDSSGVLRLGHRDGWLYVAAQVRDDGRGFAAADPNAAWNRDGIELFVDLRADRDWVDPGYAGQGGQLMVGLPPSGDGPLLIKDASANLGVAARTRSAWRSVPGGWELELAIPLDGKLAGLRPGVVAGFAAVLNDADDDSGARIRLFWAGNRDSWRDRGALGRLVMR